MNETNQRKWVVWAIISSVSLALLCCGCLLVLGSAGILGYFLTQAEVIIPTNQIRTHTNTPVEIRPTATTRSTRPVIANPSSPSETPASPSPEERLPSNTEPLPNLDTLAAGEETLKSLREVFIPPADPIELAYRLEGIDGVSTTLEPPEVSPAVGDRQQFWISNSDSNEHFRVSAVLRYITNHAYFWIEEGVDFRPRDLRDLAETFENQIYPTNRTFFGSEWSPGVDGDEHLYILYARGVGEGVVGYFSSADSLNPAIREFSNGHEMFVFSADGVTLRQEYAYATLAHEFQHMIHWYRDRNESTWMTEGFSDLAMFLNGYDIGGHDFVYVMDPDMQLNDWPGDSSLTAPHYGASFLFMTYFLDRFGDQVTQALVGHQENGLDSIDQTLAELAVTDPLSGNTIGADDVFADWVVASFLQDGQVSDGRFTYHNYSFAPQPSETESIEACQPGELTRDVHQYGVDYLLIRCREPLTLRFEGSLQTLLLPDDPHSGRYAFWSNQGDESDISLTQMFDFSVVSGPLILSYWAWFDIEKDFDYLYLMASVDGRQWDILRTPSGTGDDPTGMNVDWGYNGFSGGGSAPRWIREQVDLSAYAGKQVILRFEYITDGAVNGEGFLLDDVSIPQIGYAADFETDVGGWQADGFVRVQNVLPQAYRLSLIRFGPPTSVEYISLSPENDAEITLDFGRDLQEAVLVVSGVTRYTRQPAAYRLILR